jgi:hypothetical protein
MQLFHLAWRGAGALRVRMASMAFVDGCWNDGGHGGPQEGVRLT